MQSELIGYIRKSRSGNALNISLSAEALDSAQRYLSPDGKEYIGLVVNTAKVQEILSFLANPSEALYMEITSCALFDLL